LAKDSIQTDESKRKILNVVSISDGIRKDNAISQGEIKEINGIVFSYNNPAIGSVQLMEKDDVFMLTLPNDGQYFSMEGQEMGVVVDTELLSRNSGSIKANEPVSLNHKTL